MVVTHNRQGSTSTAKRWVLGSVITLAAVFVLSNLVLSLVYYHRALPHTQLGTLDVSGKSKNSLRGTEASDILPARLTLSHGDTKADYTSVALGITPNVEASINQLPTGWHWLPLFSVLNTHYAPIRLQVKNSMLATATDEVGKKFRRTALGKHIGLQHTKFVIQPASSGYRVDRSAFLPAVLQALQRGKSVVAVPTTPTVAIPTNENTLNSELAKLQKQLATATSFSYNGKIIRPTATDRSKWFVASGTTMTTDAAATKPYVTHLARELDITIANPDDLATAAAYATSQSDARTLSVVPSGGKTILRTYCTAAKGVDASMLTSLIETLAVTYNDIRGWNDGGKIAFQHVTSGCQYTVWLTTAANMTSFGSICDNYYNCQVGTNVILNYDRWTSATPPWNNAGGNTSDYHALMINHETGHRLGFPDNPTCPGSGQPAPVMMQQSIDLKGCTFNIWPRPTEFDRLNQSLNLGQSTSVTDIQ